MSLGLVVLEEKMFTRTRTLTPQSDDIKIKNIARGSPFGDHLTHYASAHMGPVLRWSPIQVVTKAQ